METQEQRRDLGEAVRTARSRAGLSTRQLGASIGTTYSHIAKLEAGWFKSIGPDRIQALARALGLALQDLFALSGYRVPEGLPSLAPYLRTTYGEVCQPRPSVR